MPSNYAFDFSKEEKDRFKELRKGRPRRKKKKERHCEKQDYPSKIEFIRSHFLKSICLPERTL